MTVDCQCIHVLVAVSCVCVCVCYAHTVCARTHTHTHITKALWWNKFCSGRAFFVSVPTHMCGAQMRTMQSHNGATERCGTWVNFQKSPSTRNQAKNNNSRRIVLWLESSPWYHMFIICCLRTKTFLRSNKLLMAWCSLLMIANAVARTEDH